MARSLNQKQHGLLDRIADRDSEARVIGWSDQFHGPIVRYPDLALTVARFTGRETSHRPEKEPDVCSHCGGIGHTIHAHF